MSSSSRRTIRIVGTAGLGAVLLTVFAWGASVISDRVERDRAERALEESQLALIPAHALRDFRDIFPYRR